MKALCGFYRTRGNTSPLDPLSKKILRELLCIHNAHDAIFFNLQHQVRHLYPFDCSFVKKMSHSACWRNEKIHKEKNRASCPFGTLKLQVNRFAISRPIIKRYSMLVYHVHTQASTKATGNVSPFRWISETAWTQKIQNGKTGNSNIIRTSLLEKLGHFRYFRVFIGIEWPVETERKPRTFREKSESSRCPR